MDSWPRLRVLAHLHFLPRLKRKGHGLSAEKWPRDWSQNMGLGCEAGGRGGAGSRVGGVLAGREAGLMLLVLSQALDTGTVGTSSVSLPDLQSVLDCVLSRAHSSCLLPAYFRLSPQNLTLGLRRTWSHLLVLLQGGR